MFLNSPKCFLLTSFVSLFFCFTSLKAEEEELYQLRSGCHLCLPKTEKEVALISHVNFCVKNAMLGKSRINNQKIFEIDGMSTPKVRHLLNNLCSLPNCRYLEIGIWKGSTFISALYNNQENMSEAVAIDNWSQFGGPQEEFHIHCRDFLSENQFVFLDQDSFALDPNSLFKEPVNIYFYDGCHRQESQRKAFTYYNGIFDDVFIVVVDDWSSGVHREGTYQAFDELRYEVLFEQVLPGGENEFWNGQYIAVIRR